MAHPTNDSENFNLKTAERAIAMQNGVETSGLKCAVMVTKPLLNIITKHYHYYYDRTLNHKEYIARIN